MKGRCEACSPVREVGSSGARQVSQRAPAVGGCDCGDGARRAMPFAGWEAERAGRFHKKHLRWAYAIEEWCGPCSAAREVELRKPDNRDSRQGMIDVYHALGKRGEDEGAGPSCPLLRSAAAIAGMVRAVQSRSRGERQQGPADFIKFLRSAAAIAGMVRAVQSRSRGERSNTAAREAQTRRNERGMASAGGRTGRLAFCRGLILAATSAKGETRPPGRAVWRQT